jgi:hypothetical protein
VADDGGLQGAVEAASAAAKRASEERAAADAAEKAAFQRLQKAGEAFVRRMLEAGIRPDEAQVPTGTYRTEQVVQRSGWFRVTTAERRIPEFRTARRWVVVAPISGDGLYSSGRPGLYVEEDGSVTPTPWAHQVDDVISKMAQYVAHAGA